ncbi:restriction endonuclease subunit S, partial [Vibrio cholerae]
GQNTSVIIPKNINARYLYLALNSTYVKNQIEFSVVGSTQKTLSLKAINNLEIPRFEPNIEDEIAKIGGELDDKIELNAQTNQTLEQIAQAIFKSWFVDFDPVKAKIEALATGGSTDDAELAAMSVISAKTVDELNSLKASNPEAFNKLAQTAALFPAAMQDSELGEIPEGWSVKPINTLCTKVQNGGTPKRSESLYWEKGNIPWLTSGEVRQSIITTVENRITQLGLEKSSAKWIPELSTLVALYGATAGEVSLTSIPLTTNQAVCALVPKKEHQWFNYLQLNSRVAELAGKAVGSAQQNISKGLVESTKVLSVPESLLVAFNYQVENLFKFRFSNLRQNFELATLRDSLLPKLLSGEIDLTSEVTA